ncbi:MAG: hypothetical protein PUG48_09590 [Clostridia bacterium]|nr:hypothetical protein [Clostridia bacterium]
MTKISENFDERQQIERGKAFQWAFLTSFILLVLFYMIEDLFEICKFSTYFMLITTFWISFSVFGTKVILNDAFYGIKEKTSRMIFIIFGIAGLFMLVVDIIEILNGESLVTGNQLNDIVAIMIESVAMIEMFIVSEVKRIKDKKLAEE